jgi:hypothetical protein
VQLLQLLQLLQLGAREQLELRGLPRTERLRRQHACCTYASGGSMLLQRSQVTIVCLSLRQ